MDMTVPVLMSHESDKVTMNFMIPHSVTNAPEPTEDGVTLYSAPSAEVYVRLVK